MLINDCSTCVGCWMKTQNQFTKVICTAYRMDLLSALSEDQLVKLLNDINKARDVKTSGDKEWVEFHPVTFKVDDVTLELLAKEVDTAFIRSYALKDCENCKGAGIVTGTYDISDQVPKELHQQFKDQGKDVKAYYVEETCFCAHKKFAESHKNIFADQVTKVWIQIDVQIK